MANVFRDCTVFWQTVVLLIYAVSPLICNMLCLVPGMNHEGYYYIVSEREEFFQDMAPECLWEKRYSICSDVWSFGILVYRTVTLNATPFPNMEVNELHGRMVGGERPQLLTSFSNEM